MTTLPEPDITDPIPDHKASRRDSVKDKLRRSPPKRIPPMPTGGFTEPVTNLYIAVGALLTPIDPTCGGAIINAAPQCAASVNELARQSPAVRAAIFAVLQSGAWAAVLTAHAPIFLAVLMHHAPHVARLIPRTESDLDDTPVNGQVS